MPERRYHSSARTLPPSLGYLAQQGITDLLATCQDCNNVSVVPLEEVIRKLGPDRLLMTLRGRCSVCGSRDSDIRPDYSPHSPGVIANHAPMHRA